jgi:hypothetical protein
MVDYRVDWKYWRLRWASGREYEVHIRASPSSSENARGNELSG